MIALFTALSLCVALAGPVSTPTATTPLTSHKLDVLRTNILSNLDHRIPEIRGNTMQLLIDLRQTSPKLELDYAVIPVMRILKQDADECQRIMAAVTLYHLNTRTGRYAVERRALYDDSERVARNCARIARFWDQAQEVPLLLALTPIDQTEGNFPD